MFRRLAAFALVLAAIFAVGCGGSGPSDSKDPGIVSDSGTGPNDLSASDAADVRDAQLTISGSCGDSSDPVDAADLPTAVSTIARVLQQYPRDVYEVGSTDRALEMTVLAQQTIAQLKTCQQAGQATRLQKALNDVD